MTTFDLDAHERTWPAVVEADAKSVQLRARLAGLIGQRQELDARLAAATNERDARLREGLGISAESRAARVALGVELEDLEDETASLRRAIVAAGVARSTAVREARQAARVELERELAQMGAKARAHLLEGFRIIAAQRSLAQQLLTVIRDPSGEHPQTAGSDVPARWISNEVAFVARVAGVVLDARHLGIPVDYSGSPLCISVVPQKVEVDA